jgi:single-strand DNA-binding protein
MSSLNMPNINQVALSGRLVQDPDFRFVENGAARLSGRIAVNRSYRDRNEEWQEETSFFDIVLWQKAAEASSQRLHKGTPILCHRPAAKPLLAR